MKVTRISNFFFNFKRKYKPKVKTYHFDRARYELILLKKLEDNKIFYNGIIYEPDFLHYHKLDAFVQKIYTLRDEYILKHFQLLSRKKLKRIKKCSRKYNFMNQEWITHNLQKPKIYKDIDDILQEGNTFNEYQINILISAFRYTFHYPLDYDLLDPYTRRRPIFNIDPKCDLIDPDVREWGIYKDTYTPYKFPMLIPSFYPIYQSYKSPHLIKTCRFFEDWFYIIGWRALKRIYPIFDLPTYTHYTDSLYRKRFDKLHDKEREEPYFQSAIFSQIRGTVVKDEWIIKYDEKKKFDEFDINCKTNSYYTRYKRYNEFYHELYPAKRKFKTDLVHDFTDYELSDNYANMIDKTKKAIDKWNYVMKDGKYKNAVFDFFKRVEQQQNVRRRYEYPSRWYLDADEDSNVLLDDEIWEEVYQLLNDPRYILVLPLVDAYFEIFRSKGWYFEDGSFDQYYPTDKKHLKHLEIYDMSYERQAMFIEKDWAVQEYFELEWDEYCDDHLEEEYTSLLTFIGLYAWMTLLTFYLVFIKHGILELPLYFPHLHDALDKSYEYYFNPQTRRRRYYGFELRKARMRFHSYKRPRKYRVRWREWRLRVKHRIYKFPERVCKDGNYTFYKKRTWKDLFEVLNPIVEYCVRPDTFFNLRKMDLAIKKFSYDYNIYRFRLYYVEYPMPEELQLFVPKIKKWIYNKVMRLFLYVADLKIKYDDRKAQPSIRHANYLKYERERLGLSRRSRTPREQLLFDYHRRGLKRETPAKIYPLIVDELQARTTKRTKKFRRVWNTYHSKSFFMTKRRRERARLQIIEMLGDKPSKQSFRRIKRYFSRFETYKRRRSVFEYKVDTRFAIRMGERRRRR